VRPNDGRLVFSDGNGGFRVYGWVPDATPGSTPVTQSQMLANDVIFATPACEPYESFVVPHDSAIAYPCYRNSGEPEAGSNRLFLENELTPFVSGEARVPVGLGANRTVLLSGMNELAVFANGAITPVTSGAFQQVLAVRFLDGAFVVALARSFSPTVSVELVRVGVDAQQTSIGTIDLGTVQSYFDECKLGLDRTLVCFTYEGSDDTITRFSTSAAPVEIYDERDHPVQIHISALATGP
jgi:hypothetical protein